MKIRDMNISARSKTCLIGAGYENVEDLYEVSDDDLLKIKNLNQKCLHEIREYMITDGMEKQRIKPIEDNKETDPKLFEYEERRYGIVITRYIGNLAVKRVRFPRTINGKNVVMLGEGVFQNDQWFNYEDIVSIEVEIPDTVKIIQATAFEGVNIKKITINEGLKVIGYDAFAQSSMEELQIPSTVEEIDESAFGCCMNLRIKNNNNCNHFVVEDGKLYDVWKKVLLFHPYNYEKGINIKDSVTRIGDNVFSFSADCYDLNSDKIQRIKNSISEFMIPEHISEIGVGCFSHSGWTIILHDGLTKIGGSAFSNCRIKGDIDGLLRKMNKIEEYLFDCTELLVDGGVLRIPENIECIEAYAFNHVKGIDMIIIPGSITAFSLDCFGYSASVREIIVSDGVKKIERNTNMPLQDKIVEIPRSVTFIDDNAFKKCCFICEKGSYAEWYASQWECTVEYK